MIPIIPELVTGGGAAVHSPRVHGSVVSALVCIEYRDVNWMHSLRSVCESRIYLRSNMRFGILTFDESCVAQLRTRNLCARNGICVHQQFRIGVNNLGRTCEFF